MSAERIDKLEKAFIKLESTMDNMNQKMVEVADSLKKMSTAVSQLAIYDMKLDMLKQDLSNIATQYRQLNSKVDSLHTEHYEECDTNLKKVSKDSIGRFVAGISLLAFAFGYMYLDIKAQREYCETLAEKLQRSKITTEKLKGKVLVLEEKLNAANRKH